MRLFTFERRVVVQQLLTCFWRVGEGCGSLAKARVDVPTTLSLSLWLIVVAGKRSVLVR